MPLISSQGRTTDPSLLKRVGDWRDSEAWQRFIDHYNPHLRAVCRRYGLNGDAADDCCQQVWENLARTMRKFRYDPGLRFRGWLHRFFHSRVKDVLKATAANPFEEPLTEDPPSSEFDPGRGEVPPADPEILAMLRQAEEVQAAVRARVTPDNWQVFRLIAIESLPTPDAARFLGREYVSVYRAYKRISRIVDEERRRRQAVPND